MKKRNAKVIQIAGIRGLLLVGFVAVCLAAGFIVFPGLVAMHLWNYAVSFTYFIPAINIYQGILLWAIFGITGFIINDRKKFLAAYKAPTQLSEEEMRKLMERVKIQSQAQMLNSMILKSKELQSMEEKNNVEKIDKLDKEEAQSQEKDIHKV